MMDERDQYDEDLRASYEGLGVEVLRLEGLLAAATQRAEEAKRYADKLVQSMPGLPKDLEVLRTGNTNLANENAILLVENRTLLAAVDEVRKEATYHAERDMPVRPRYVKELCEQTLGSAPLTAAEVERVQELEADRDDLREALRDQQDERLRDLNALQGEVERLREALQEELRVCLKSHCIVRCDDCRSGDNQTCNVRVALAPKADAGGEG